MSRSSVLHFVGDLCLDGLESSEGMLRGGLEELLAEEGAYNVANLEHPLVDVGGLQPRKGTLWPLHGPQREHRVLSRFHAFGLANNHMLDYGLRGLTSTLDCLGQWGKASFGAGLGVKGMLAPLLVERGAVRLALLGATRWCSVVRSGRRLGGTSPDSLWTVIPTIRRLKASGYQVVVCPHWGYEYVDYPAPSSRRWAQRAIDAGADLIVGSHPHVLQGIESYRGRTIAYSLGNFLFGGRHFSLQTGRLHETLLLRATFRSSEPPQVEVHPLRTRRGHVELMEERDARDLLRRVDDLSRVLTDPAAARRAFYEGTREVLYLNHRVLRAAGDGSLWRARQKRLPTIRAQDVLVSAYASQVGTRRVDHVWQTLDTVRSWVMKRRSGRNDDG